LFVLPRGERKIKGGKYTAGCCDTTYGILKVKSYSLHSLLIVLFSKLKSSQMIVLVAIDKDHDNK